MGSGNGLVPVGGYGVALEERGEKDGDSPRPGGGHHGEDRIAEGLSDAEEADVEEEDGHFDGNDGEGQEDFVAPIQLDMWV